MAQKSLAETIRSIAVGKSKKVIGKNANTVRATCARVLGSGNYSVSTVADTQFNVTRHL